MKSDRTGRKEAIRVPTVQPKHYWENIRLRVCSGDGMPRREVPAEHQRLQGTHRRLKWAFALSSAPPAPGNEREKREEGAKRGVVSRGGNGASAAALLRDATPGSAIGTGRAAVSARAAVRPRVGGVATSGDGLVGAAVGLGAHIGGALVTIVAIDGASASAASGGADLRLVTAHAVIAARAVGRQGVLGTLRRHAVAGLGYIAAIDRGAAFGLGRRQRIVGTRGAHSGAELGEITGSRRGSALHHHRHEGVLGAGPGGAIAELGDVAHSSGGATFGAHAHHDIGGAFGRRAIAGLGDITRSA